MGHGTDTEPGRRLSDCVTALLRDQPFFGSLALRLPLVEDSSRKTLASDGAIVRYNPRWVKDTGADLIQTALARVVLACALKHHTRRGERQPERWQHASQLVTHGLLRADGFTLPPEAEAWDGFSVEQAYERLPEPQGESPDKSPGAGNGAGAPRPGSSGSHPPGASPGDASQARPGNAGEPPPSNDPAGTGEVLDATARCPAGGSPADGTPAGANPAQGNPDGASRESAGRRPAGRNPAGRNPAGRSPDRAPMPGFDVEAEEQAWDQAMQQAASVARAQGNLPGAVKRTLSAAHRSRLDWRSLLRRYMLDTAENDCTWSFPNRRFIDSGLYLPSVRSEGMDAIALIVDTSRSLRIPELRRTWAEIRAIAAELRPERMFVLQVDTDLHRVDEYGPDDLPERLTVKGRGGTDFRPGFRWIEERGVRLACCLYFTDMECNRHPEIPPDYPVIWINQGPAPPERYREPWGERIDLG